MDRSNLLLHAAFIGVATALFSGCPSLEEPCTSPVPIEVTEPSLGEHEATLTWLQTGLQTTLQLTATAMDSATPDTCSPTLNVAYTLVSADGTIDLTFEASERVSVDGTLDDTFTALLEPRRTLEAGVAPELPDLLDRNPTIALNLERTDTGYGDGEIRAFTANGSDNVALAIISVVRAP